MQPAIGQGAVQHIEAKDTLRVTPGKVLTLSLSVVNPSSHTASVEIGALLPDNWKQLIKNKPISFDGEQEKTILQHIYIEGAALAGLFNVQYEVNFPQKSYIYSFPCIVEEVDNATLSFGKIPPFIKAGDSIKTALQVSNLGNVRREFLVTYSGINQLKLTERITIDPSSSVTLEINEVSNKNLEHQSNEYLYANVSLDENEKPMAYTSTSTRVIPQKEKPYDRFVRLPSYVGSSYFGRNRGGDFEGGWQAEAYGTGYLDESNRHEIEYRLRGPGRYYISSMGNYEEYFLKYEGPKFAVTLGDNNYRLSMLTEYSRYGRGASLATRIGKTTFGGYYMQPRFYPELKEAIAGFVEYTFDKRSRLRANYVQKSYNYTHFQSHVSSIEGFFSPLDNTKLEVEFGVSSFGDKRDMAYRGNITSSLVKNLSVNGHIVYAGKDFQGYYNNSLYFGGNAYYAFTKKWSANVGISKSSYNIALDTLFTQAPSRQDNYLGVSFRANQTHQYSLQGGYRSGKDRMQEQRYTYEEYYGRINHNYTQEKLRLYSTIEMSKTKNLLASNQHNSMWRQYVSSNINYQANTTFNLGAFGSYSRHNRYTNDIENYVYAGASVNMSFASKSRLMLSVQNSFSIEDDYQDRSYFNMNFSHFFTPRHELIIDNRYALPRKQTKDAVWEFGVQYRFHFGIPVGKKSKRLASLKGIIDTYSLDNIPRSDVLLQMSGKSVYTDKEGQFEFKNMQPGEHFIFIDKSGMGIDVVANTAEPIKVTLKEDEENFVPIQLFKSAELKGMIILHEEEDSEGEENLYKSSEAVEKLKKAADITPVIVELYNDEKSYKRITDKNGEFVFQQIVPGNWKLKIYPNGLLKNYKLKKNEYDLELESGKSNFLEIPIYPKSINIKFRPANTSMVQVIK